ncbi:STE20-like serine/threonine-protein kinase isoform X3 [Cataglyphis hispanica]|uniref:STE20-like serine/threonine-protein kinase isoform X3 n=1 Tax=Cataglyphis hispanica TaxID=1086592 RepID=UPI00217F3851|nr:STE20-like serine/threonine-protein kinase isoform X3 [Cataglyphis hispanica]
MAKNVGESRIPVPRATRPSFFPKSRVLEASRLLSGSRRSTIFSGCFQFVNTEDESPTPREKFPGFTSTPNIKTDSASDQTFTISPGWDIDKNDVQQLVHLSEEKSSLFRLLEDSQLSMIEDVGDTCLVESGLGNYNDANAAPHYLMLNKQNSFEHDESLGILTPDQMTDFTVALECSRTPSCENLTGSAGSKLALTRASASTRPLVDVEPAEEGCSERTPSPEELPLDPKPVEPIRGGNNTVPVSFVTSVTSITSLEAGYQGDGENSRPASRGADPPSMAVPPVNLPAPCRQDPMTDSDFFTESDADAHEEIVRGDRKAQVIDGTLFCAPGERVCPSFTGEEMDSSGIYSDLDKLQAPGEQISEENDDHTPDTGDTELSQRSQPTPVAANVIMDYLQIPVKTSDETSSINDTTASAEVMLIEKDENNENIRPKPQSKADSVPLKKYKMPKRNVVSKIKAMIESSSKDDAEKEARRSQRSTRKGGRWDAVMNKIEAGKNEQRTRSARKEVKSRVLQNLTLSPAARPTSKKAGDANNNNNKDKRRTRGWQEMKSPTQETARSSVRSSMSDLSSGPSKDIPKRSPTSTNPPRRFVSNGHANHHQVRVNSFDAKKNCIDVTTVELEKSPPSARKPAITRRLAANATVKQKSSTPSIKDRESKETHHNSSYTVRTSPETRDQAAQTTVPYEDFRVERAAQALAVTVHYLAFELDAFATPQLKKDFEKLKIDYEKMKNERSTMLSEIDGLRARYVSMEERLETEREDHNKDLDQLRDELEAHRAKQISALVETLKEERRKYDVRLEEITREHRATIAKLRAEHVNELARKEEMKRSVVHDQGAALMAEIESLRSVLELKSQENAALRSELDSYRRDVEEKDALQIRLDMAEARCEDLKAQLQRKESFERQVSHENEMLHESIHQVSKHNKRLSQRNEELQWKLRNKNDWVSVLANQLNPRLTRSTGAEQMEHSFSAEKNGAHSSSMMKFMVEKGASVSWTLEIDDLSKELSSDSLNTKVSRPAEGATTVSRQGSLRLSNRTPAMDTRARSKSVSTTCDSARTAAVDEAAWTPTFSSTPVSRRRPRKDQSSPCSSSSSSSSTSSAAPTVNPAVAAAVAAAAAAVDECSIGGGQRPQEAGGEAMISEETSASSSEDESSTGSDIPRLGIQFAWGKPIK